MITNLPIPMICHGAGILFMALGAGATGIAFRWWWLAAASKTWPSVPGRVLRSFITEKTGHYEDRGYVTEYQARVEYEFSVDSQQFSGNRIQFGGPQPSEDLDWVRTVVNYYTDNPEVDVYYDPRKPSQCTLERSTAWLGIFGLMLAGMTTVALGATIFLLPPMN